MDEVAGRLARGANLPATSSIIPSLTEHYCRFRGGIGVKLLESLPDGQTFQQLYPDTSPDNPPGGPGTWGAA